jgi:hypothetical protein
VIRNQDLLPGVVREGCEPKVVCDSRAIVTRARRLALVRDVVQLVIVGAVDRLFVLWPLSHIPWVGRGGSLLILVAFNALVVAHVIVSRKLPRWNARRIASTWGASERKRFATATPQRGRR